MSTRLSTLTRLAVLAVTLVAASCAEDTPVMPGDNDTVPIPNPADTIPPVEVTDGALQMSAGADAAVFTWSAPHDNEPDQAVDRYEIRFAYTRGFPPPGFWDGLSTPVGDPPQPAAPGTPQSYVFRDLDLGRDLWVGIRSYDVEGNRSPGSVLAMAHVPGVELVGRCVDVLTGQPVAGIAVHVSAGASIHRVTDGNGEFAVDDLVPGAVSVEIETGSAPAAYHAMSEVLVIGGDTTHVFPVIPYQTTSAPELGGMSQLAFFKIITETSASPGLLARWLRFPVPVYIPPFVNGEGLDYGAAAQNAAQRWIDATGIQLFEFVGAPPDTGITVVYRKEADIDPLDAFTRHNLGADGHPLTREIHIRDNIPAAAQVFLDRVMLHEFGHTIRLGHVDWNTFIMYWGQPLPDDPADDEIAAVVLYHALPPRIKMSIYDASAP